MERTKLLKRWINHLLTACIVLSICVMETQYSTVQEFFAVLEHPLLIFAVNLSIISLIYLFLMVIFRSTTVACAIICSLTMILSVTNYYTIQFHGSPLFISVLRNAQTAFKVLGSYNIKPDRNVGIILLLYLIVIAGLFLRQKLSSEYILETVSGCAFISIVGALIINFAMVYTLFFSPFAVFSSTLGWSWRAAVKECGYLCVAVNDLKSIVEPFTVPDGYSSSLLDSGDVQNETGEISNKPSIIMILNETFCDINDYTEINADSEYISSFYDIEGAQIGRAVVSSVGGGTNNSEYELLTSNSMYLLNAEAPFNYIDFTKSNDSIVRYLKSLNYESYAMHCEEATNYNRQAAYPEIGFDHIVLGGENFHYYSEYGNRRWTDSDNYKDLIQQFEKKSDGPKFIYMLTFQNHGGYEQNTDDWDLVHTKADFGELTDDINEYLTSIKQSSDAIKDLVDYFRSRNEPVIICMVGDHAPSFVNALSPRTYESQERDEINKRTVPYMIWSNCCDTSIYQDFDYISLIDLAPMAVKLAGLPLSSYYNQILNMHGDISAITSMGTYLTSDGTIEHFTQDSRFADELNQYFYMEYNKLKAGSDYVESLFQPAGIKR